MYIWNWGTHF